MPLAAAVGCIVGTSKEVADSMNELDDIVRQARADVQELEGLLDSAEARVAVAQADAAAIRARLEKAHTALEWWDERRKVQPVAASPMKQAEQPESQPQTRFGRPVPEGDTKLKKLLEALEDLGGRASNKQIGTRAGMKPDHVRGLLKYAASKEHPPVVTEPGSGVWRLTRSLNGAGGAR
jgi:chromosome segregation ATPase